ncbi:unnamed protein product [Brassica oleracea]
MAAEGSMQKGEEEWRAVLSPEQFRILRLKGTEYPGTGEYIDFNKEGIYGCAGSKRLFTNQPQSLTQVVAGLHSLMESLVP